MASENQPEPADVKGYRWWQWILGFFFLPILILMIIGVSNQRLRPKLSYGRIWIFCSVPLFLFLVCTVFVGIIVDEPEKSSTQPQAVPTPIPTQAPTLAPTLPPKPTQTISQSPTATARPSTATHGQPGLGASRRELRRIYEEDLRITCSGGVPIADYIPSDGYETWTCHSVHQFSSGCSA